MRDPLTRKAQVREVLAAGGHATTLARANGNGLARLYDQQGAEVPAWQQAISANLTDCDPTGEHDTPHGRVRYWKLRA